jgi:hypothetical protein
MSGILFTKHSQRLLPVALWRAQNVVYGETRHPYVMLGPHFTKIRFWNGNVIKYLGARLKQAIRAWRNQAERSDKDDVKTNAADYADFLERELKSFAEKWKLN